MPGRRRRFRVRDLAVTTRDTQRTKEAPLRITDLVIRYPGRREPSLRGISLGVSAGERVAVAGRTGAGKSTLALAAAGFIPRVVRATVGGSVTIAGVDSHVADAGRLLGRVGIVFATPANQLSASKLTVREELAFGLENLGVPRIEMDPRIDAVLERLGIDELADREPFSLSGGEQQRVAIASIIAMGTDILVLDEPTAQLDPAGTASVADLIDGLARSGTAILCAEHAPTVLGRADRCLVLDDGRPVTLDRPGPALWAAGREVALRPPTLVRLANVAGVAPGHEFDEAAIAAGLASRRPIPAPADDRATTAEAWSPGQDRAPVRVDVQGLVHRYPNGIEAVRGVSLTIEPGEAVVILGQNGSGKTTLVKHLNGLLRPDAGRVLLDGETNEAVTVDKLAGIVGFVFQNPDEQLFERSVEREVAFGPKNLRRPADQIAELVARSLDAVGLTDVRAVNPYDLDLSRRKLVALAGVLAMDPAILVLDEPTTGQDAAGIERVGAVVRAYQDAGRSVVAITHDMEFAATNFTRVIVMRLGEIVADGPPSVIFAPDHRDLLATTGLLPPPAARIAAAMGLPIVPVDAEALLSAIRNGAV
jgi:energy-coupling factor transporter ATP-binding protein EcfA2